jgi:hypothetical protein
MGWSTSKKKPRLAPIAYAIEENWRPEFEAASIDWDHLVTLDFETYYDDEYTLKKLSTSEYIRDDRFEVIMVGIKIGSGETKVYPGGDLARRALAAIDWSTHALLCHHTQFDGLILSHHFGVVPSKYYCSLSMARGWLSNDIGAGLDEVSKFFGRKGKEKGDALVNMKGIRLANMHPEVWRKGADYCYDDVEENLATFCDLLPDFSQPELDLIDATVQMFTCPVLKLDEARARKALALELAERKKLLLEVAPTSFDAKELESSWRSDARKQGIELVPESEAARLFLAKKIIGSSPRFALLLEEEGIDPPLKISPSWLAKKPEERDPNKQFTFAFAKDDPAMQELLDDENPRVRALCEARIAVKSTTSITRAERLLRSGAGGRVLPVYYKYAGAHTWRFSGGDKQNWQNFKRGSELRLSICAPRGYQLVVADSSQIEARVNAWLWGQHDLLDAFRNGEDIYSLFATENIYGVKVTKADKEKRHVGKTAILGLGFQMGAKKFRATLARGVGGPAVRISEEQAALIVQAYRRRYSAIADGWKICEQIIEDMAVGRQGEWKCIRWEKETLWLPNGMRLKYPRLRMNDEGQWTYTRKGNVIKLYGGLLCENIVQALARIIVASEQLLAIAREYLVVMTTHDEVVSCVPTREAKKCQRHMERCMKTAPKWAPDLPVTCEAGYAPNYSK